MKITNVAEIVNITNVAGILEAEICGAETMRAVLMYNHHKPGFMDYWMVPEVVTITYLPHEKCLE